VRKSFLRAVKSVSTLTGLRPYDLRHSFGTRVFLTSGSLHAAGELLQHADKRTTKRYTLAAVNPVLTAALGTWQTGQKNGTKAGES
jgi:Site-specific recombinase XerD